MTKTQMLHHYSVQPVENGKLAAKRNWVGVEAISPIQAGEMALGERLTSAGPATELRAVVWSMSENFTPLSYRLYKAAD